MELPYIRIGISVVFLFFSAFFSASETALFSIPREKINLLRDGAGRRGRQLFELLIDGQRTLYLLLLGNLFVNITLTGSIYALVDFFRPGSSPLLTMFLATVVIVLFGEMLPKNFALKHNERVGRLVAPLLVAGKYAVSPLLSIVTRVNSFFLVRFKRRFKRPSPYVTAAELKSNVMESRRSGVISTGEHEVLVSLLDQGMLPVAQCMDHRSHLLMLPETSSCSEARNAAAVQKQTHIFVYAKEQSGRVQGVVHLSSILRSSPDTTLGELTEPLDYIPDTMDAAEALNVFLGRNLSVIAVVDEYGAFIGALTLDRGIRHIFRPVFSSVESGEKTTVIADGTNGVYRGETEIVLLGWLPRALHRAAAGSRTLSGALTNYLGTIPAEGDKFAIDGYNFYILEASPVKIESVFIKKRHEYEY